MMKIDQNTIVVVVTGASAGSGRATPDRQRGAEVEEFVAALDAAAQGDQVTVGHAIIGS